MSIVALADQVFPGRRVMPVGRPATWRERWMYVKRSFRTGAFVVASVA